MTNVQRHARATHREVTLRANGRLELTLRDDGAGIAASAEPGIGLASMRERAAELGGTLVVQAAGERPGWSDRQGA